MDRIKQLLLRFLREEISPEEQAELDRWLAAAPANRALLEELQDPARIAEALAKLDQLHRQEAWARVGSYAESHRPEATQRHESPHRLAVLMGDDRSARRRRIVRWSSAAAAVVLLVAGPVLWLQKTKKNQAPAVAVAAAPVHDALPGGNKAILTLSGGRQVILDSASEDTVLTEGAAIVAGAKGRLAYNPGNQADATVVYNTLTTPRGGQYQLTLPDGSRVWLNAQSSITYPTAFTGPDRTVSITGEAYFEVAQNPSKPFKVTAAGETINVLGTAFNINAYADEVIAKTTLLEGSIAVDPNDVNRRFILKPGQQAWISMEKTTSKGEVPAAAIYNGADLTQVMAWKNGLFAFNNADLPTVMRQLSRWYNVDVKYEGNIPTDQFQFNGKIGKSLTLDQVLKILTKTQVHYSIEGNQLTIRP
jgi:ferric-dicitrate binding protein FerR (iron transport regulator)